RPGRHRRRGRGGRRPAVRADPRRAPAPRPDDRPRRGDGRAGRARYAGRGDRRRDPRRRAGGARVTRSVVAGRLVLADSVVAGRITIDDGWIVSVEPDAGGDPDDADVLLAPGFVDVHVHGWGGHDAMGELAD